MPEPAHLLVMAKVPEPGKVKTRLSPQYSPDEAAQLARAALDDTLDAVRACSADRRILALDGAAPLPSYPGFNVIPQVDGPFEARLAAAWEAAGAPGLQIGMDTPQVTPELLDECLGRLAAPDADAVLGLAHDGGWWAIGLAEPTAGVFEGVPMSTDRTGKEQLARLEELGLRTVLLPELFDIDEAPDVAAVARQFPDLGVAAVARDLGPRP